MAVKDVLVREPIAIGAALAERTLVVGDLKDLTPGQRVEYYVSVCRSLGLNPLTKPFEYISLNSKLTLYALRGATDQLRKSHEVSVIRTQREKLDDLYVVTVGVRDASGREDESIGAVSIAGLKGEGLANAMMKAETKAKRRATLSLVGLGWLDESEVGGVEDARRVVVDHSTGEILSEEPPRSARKSEPMVVTADYENGKTPAVQEMAKAASQPTVSRSDFERMYLALYDKAQVYGLRCVALEPNWPKVELVRQYRALKAEVAKEEAGMNAREGELFSAEDANGSEAAS